MIYGSIILLGIAAILGLTIATAIFQEKETPKPIVFTHGGLAATGLILLIIYAVQHPADYPLVGLIVLIIAAIGGFYLFSKDMKRKKPGPGVVIVIHALAAVSGVILLLYFVL